VSTAVSRLLPAASASVQKLSIIPRTGGALGFTYIPPNTEDRALLFDAEIRGQLAMLLGGRAAEQLTCGAVSTGAARRGGTPLPCQPRHGRLLAG
jgi:cell division protease FtsH